MSDSVTIAADGLTARIALLGAELQSLTDSDGHEYMTDADPAYWTGHAPFLFPIVGALNNDELRVDGRSYPMKKHGFARKSLWELVSDEGNAATFRLQDSAATRAGYPFAFVLTVRHSLAGGTFSTIATVSNPGESDLPFSFGFHPAFAWPLPDGGDKLGHIIEFATDEPQPIRRLDDNGLIAFEEPSPIDGRTLALDPALFEADALIWDHLASRAVSYRSPGGTRLDIGFPDTPMLGIWQKPGARFICIEPWAGIADPAGYAGEFRDKPGVMLLPPGERRSFRMDVRVHRG